MKVTFKKWDNPDWSTISGAWFELVSHLTERTFFGRHPKMYQVFCMKKTEGVIHIPPSGVMCSFLDVNPFWWDTVLKNAQENGELLKSDIDKLSDMSGRIYDRARIALEELLFDD